MKELSRYKLIILPNVLTMDQEEVEAFKNYVASGGNYMQAITHLF